MVDAVLRAVGQYAMHHSAEIQSPTRCAFVNKKDSPSGYESIFTWHLKKELYCVDRRNRMKTAVIYFSLEGNTKYAAGKIAAKLGADLIRLIPVKEYPTGKVSKYFWGGKSATFGEAPRLEPYRFDQNQYDLVILGTPIWAGTFAPPLRTFMRENKLTGKKNALFASCSGGSTEKCFEQLKKLNGDCTVVSTLRLIDPLKGTKSDVDRSIEDFCAML